MTRYLIGAGLALAAFFLVLATAGGQTPPAGGCYPVDILARADQVAKPAASQARIEGWAAREYLRLYNGFGRPTAWAGDGLFVSIDPDGWRTVVPLSGGIGCPRVFFVVGPRLHDAIIAEIAKGEI
jgi:hypothetical protein